MAITARRIYAEMQGIRAKDTYPDEEVKAYLVEKTFPRSAEEMTLKLSNVSAAFYGLMLAHIGDRFGWREADTISKAVFRKLGQLKTREALELGVDPFHEPAQLPDVALQDQFDAPFVLDDLHLLARSEL